MIIHILISACKNIKPEANFVKELSANSLDVFELVMSIKNKAASKIATVQNALNYLEGQCNKN